MLEGSVRKSGDRVRITGQLIEAATGAHLWADKFDGALEDVFGLQDQVTARVVGAVAPSVERAEIERAQIKATGDLGAYDCYLRGRATRHGASPESNQTALAFYRRAIDLDPAFGRAYAWAAYSLQVQWLQNWARDRQQTVAEGTTYAEKSVSFGQSDAEALSLAAFFFALVRHELDIADKIIDQAASLNPNLVWVRSIRGWVSVWIGRPEEAVHQLEAAIRLSPVDVVDLTGTYAALGAAYNYSGRPEVAMSWIAKALARSPNHVPALTNAIVASAALGCLDEARRYGERVLKIIPQMTISSTREVMAFRRPQDLDLVFGSLRLAGIPA